MRGGREAVSTRAVSAAAGVQAPAIYRQFGDMRELLHAAARELLTAYVREKAAREPTDDPLEDLRRGWDLHVAFGLAHPAAYGLLYGTPIVEADEPAEPAVREGYAILQALVARIAKSGQLRVSVTRAARLIHAGGCGVTLSLLATRPEERDLRLSDAMREAVLAAITVARPSKSSQKEGTLAVRAVALQAVLAEAGSIFSPAEQHLLTEWLDRLAHA
ncbi:MAG: tetR [Myxococcaceae bacterium]|nr:tetR [Myxococcaceae bacterium]